MTEVFVFVAMGTAAALLAVVLLLLRIDVGGRRIALELVQRWVAADARASAMVLALLGAIAAYAFSFTPAGERNEAGGATAASPEQGMASESVEDDPELAALRAYANKGNVEPQPAEATAAASDQPELPDVQTMIGKLVARLEKEPGDVRGWKMLGWSYLNTGRTEDALKAYEKALALNPNDTEVKKAIDAMQSAETAPDQTASIDSANPASPPAAAADPSAEADTGMIRSMVEQLDKRLATSPKDENGWLMLMRSRVMLGEADAARAALARAREVFAGDAAATSRLTAMAMELGIVDE